MNRSIILGIVIILQVAGGAKTILPPEIETTFRLAGQPLPEDPNVSYREKKSFVEFVTGNWSEIVRDIECLPPGDGDDPVNIRFNVSVINFGIACDKLPPMEYLEFFEQIVTLYE